MTREEQLQAIKTAASLGGWAQVLAPRVLPLLGTLGGAAMGAQANPDNPLLGATLGGVAGYTGGGLLGRGVRGVAQGIPKGKPLRQMAEDVAGHRVFPLMNNALPLAGAAGGAMLGWSTAPLGEEGSGAMYGALTGLGLGSLGRAANIIGYRKARNAVTGAKKPISYFDPESGQMVRTTQGNLYRMNKTSSYEGLLSYGYSIPGTPLNLRMDTEKAERLPGMSRWAPRSIIEDAFLAQESGADEDVAVEHAANKGLLMDPLMGAGAGALAAPMLVGGPELQSRLIGALAGGSLGLAANLYGREDRRRMMREALKGVAVERGRFPMSRQDDSTAASASPLLLASGSGGG
jgi:hypothetical protein